VDADEQIRKLLHFHLRRMGAKVLQASRGEQALELIRQSERVDLVLLDPRLPDLPGMETLREINRAGKVGSTIVMTLNGTVADATAAMREGAYDFVNKTNTFDEVDLAIRNALNTLGLKRELAELMEDLAGVAVRGNEPEATGRPPTDHHHRRPGEFPSDPGAMPPEAATARWDRLTTSERRAVVLAGLGLSNAEIAETLDRARMTVVSHLYAAFAKLEISTRRDLPDLLTALPAAALRGLAPSCRPARPEPTERRRTDETPEARFCQAWDRVHGALPPSSRSGHAVWLLREIPRQPPLPLRAVSARLRLPLSECAEIARDLERRSYVASSRDPLDPRRPRHRPDACGRRHPEGPPRCRRERAGAIAAPPP
jgi:DNA-binding NarL/FixJ family response regulator